MSANFIALCPDQAFGPVLDWMLSRCKDPIQPTIEKTLNGSWVARVGMYSAEGSSKDLATNRCIALSQLGRLVDVPVSVVLAGVVPTVAARFALGVHEHYLSLPNGEALYRAMLEANKAEFRPDVCHTHDHCDANVFMAQAIEDVLGVDPAQDDLINDPAMMRLWNAAWDLAKAVYLADLTAAQDLVAPVLTGDAASSGDVDSTGLQSPGAPFPGWMDDEEVAWVKKCLAVDSKWKEFAVRDHVDFHGDDEDPVKFFDDLVWTLASDRTNAIERVFADHDACGNERYENDSLTSVSRYIQNMATSLQAIERPASLADGHLLSMICELDAYLREIRAENLDGSEPALGELLEESLAMRLAAQQDASISVSWTLLGNLGRAIEELSASGDFDPRAVKDAFSDVMRCADPEESRCGDVQRPRGG